MTSLRSSVKKGKEPRVPTAVLVPLFDHMYFEVVEKEGVSWIEEHLSEIFGGVFRTCI